MRITSLLLFLVIALRAAAADPSPTAPAFWLDRAARDVAAAKDVVEYDGPFPRVTAFETAADLYRADPTPDRRKLLEDKLRAGEAQLDAATQPWRKWYGRLILARVYRADLKDDAAYRRHLAAADALGTYLPDRAKNAPLFQLVRGTELASAGDADALRTECAASAKTIPEQLMWYARVAARCIDLGHPEGARAALDQLAADASVPSAGNSLALAQHLLAIAYATNGDDSLALDALKALDGPRRFNAALHLLRVARRTGHADVTKKVQTLLADVLPPTVGPAAGAYVSELALAGDAATARDVGRAALRRGPAGQPAPFYAALAAGLYTAGDRDTAATAIASARQALAATTDAPSRASALLWLAAAHARAGEWDAMTTASADAAKVEGVTEAELTGDREQLVETLLDLKRWDDVTRALAPIRGKPDRDAWVPRIVAAQVRAGATDLAAASAKTLDGFIRARCYRRIAIERAKRKDVADLPAWIDQMDTPLRRAATDLAIAQFLDGKPVRAAGFPPDED